MIQALAKMAIALALAAMTTGCISYHSDATRSHQFSQVHAGETTTGWLLDHYGAPSRIEETSLGTEIWHYEVEEAEDTDVSFFILFDFSSTTRRTRNFFFEVDQGLVTKSWRGVG